MLVKGASDNRELRCHHWSWWCHQTETFSALLAICAGNSPVTGEFLAQRPVTRSFGAFFDLCLNERLSKQWWGWWFETPSRPLRCHCNGWKRWQIKNNSFHCHIISCAKLTVGVKIMGCFDKSDVCLVYMWMKIKCSNLSLVTWHRRINVHLSHTCMTRTDPPPWTHVNIVKCTSIVDECAKRLHIYKWKPTLRVNRHFAFHVAVLYVKMIDQWNKSIQIRLFYWPSYLCLPANTFLCINWCVKIFDASNQGRILYIHMYRNSWSNTFDTWNAFDKWNC